MTRRCWHTSFQQVVYVVLADYVSSIKIALFPIKKAVYLIRRVYICTEKRSILNQNTRTFDQKTRIFDQILEYHMHGMAACSLIKRTIFSLKRAL